MIIYGCEMDKHCISCLYVAYRIHNYSDKIVGYLELWEYCHTTSLSTVDMYPCLLKCWTHLLYTNTKSLIKSVRSDSVNS